jgi:formamidase
MPGNVEPRYSEFLTFVGFSVDKFGKQHFLDSTLAYQNACLNAIEYFSKFGWTREQVYLMLGAAPVEGRLSGVVDVPNSCATLYVPTAIFDIDVRPSAQGPQRIDRRQCAVST